MSKFQTKPGLLLDLIPLKSPNKKRFFVYRKNKEKDLTEAHTPENFETLHQENETHFLTEDWKKSLLYFNIRKSPNDLMHELRILNHFTGSFNLINMEHKRKDAQTDGALHSRRETLLDNQEISHSFNSSSLRRSMKPIYLSLIHI